MMVDGTPSKPSIESDLRRQLDVAQAITHIGSWEWTVATSSVVWSDELYRIYGFAPRSVPITLEFFLGRIHPDERLRIEGEIRGVLRQPGRFAYRERIVRPDGSARTLDTTGDAEVDEAGAVVRLVGTCRDVTDQVASDERIRFYASVFEHAELGLSAFQLDRGPPPELRLAAFNAATERMLGAPLAEKLGLSLAAVIPALAHARPGTGAGSSAETGLDAARSVAIGGPVVELPPFRVTSAPDAPLLAAKLFALPGCSVGLALSDVTAQVAGQIIEAGERRALEMLADGEPLAAILEVIVRAIEQASVDTIASILLLDDSGTHVRHGAAPNLPDAFNAAIDGQPIGPRAGSCGTAMFRREPVIVGDIERDPLWQDYRALARTHDLRSCWSFPILDQNGSVLGTFALYHRSPREIDDTSRELMRRTAHVAGIVLERRALDEQRRALAGRIEAAREDERGSIARDIHDHLGQALTALKLDVGWLQRRIRDAELSGKLDEMARSADEVLRSVRRIASDLRPSVLDDLGLLAAIEWQADDFTRRTATPCIVRCDVGEPQLERGLVTNVFRIFQEALTNIARHASAQHVEVTLGLAHGQLRLEIADDGVGVPDVGPRNTTLGILGMRERAWRLGGECTIKRQSPRGTIVSVVVPLRFPADQRELRSV